MGHVGHPILNRYPAFLLTDEDYNTLGAVTVEDDGSYLGTDTAGRKLFQRKNLDSARRAATSKALRMVTTTWYGVGTGRPEDDAADPALAARRAAQFAEWSKHRHETPEQRDEREQAERDARRAEIARSILTHVPDYDLTTEDGRVALVEKLKFDVMHAPYGEGSILHDMAQYVGVDLPDSGRVRDMLRTIVDAAATPNLPAERPTCPQGHGPMQLRDGWKPGQPGNGHTYEQQFCGIWYDCTVPGCHASTLLESPGLLAQLAQMTAAR